MPLRKQIDKTNAYLLPFALTQLELLKSAGVRLDNQPRARTLYYKGALIRVSSHEVLGETYDTVFIGPSNQYPILWKLQTSKFTPVSQVVVYDSSALRYGATAESTGFFMARNDTLYLTVLTTLVTQRHYSAAVALLAGLITESGGAKVGTVTLDPDHLVDMFISGGILYAVFQLGGENGAALRVKVSALLVRKTSSVDPTIVAAADTLSLSSTMFPASPFTAYIPGYGHTTVSFEDRFNGIVTSQTSVASNFRFLDPSGDPLASAFDTTTLQTSSTRGYVASMDLYKYLPTTATKTNLSVAKEEAVKRTDETGMFTYDANNPPGSQFQYTNQISKISGPTAPSTNVWSTVNRGALIDGNATFSAPNKQWYYHTAKVGYRPVIGSDESKSESGEYTIGGTTYTTNTISGNLPSGFTTPSLATTTGGGAMFGKNDTTLFWETAPTETSRNYRFFQHTETVDFGGANPASVGDGHYSNTLNQLYVYYQGPRLGDATLNKGSGRMALDWIPVQSNYYSSVLYIDSTGVEKFAIVWYRVPELFEVVNSIQFSFRTRHENFVAGLTEYMDYLDDLYIGMQDPIYLAGQSTTYVTQTRNYVTTLRGQLSALASLTTTEAIQAQVNTIVSGYISIIYDSLGVANSLAMIMEPGCAHLIVK